MLEGMTCPGCGEGTLHAKSMKGVAFPHRQFDALTVDDDIKVPVCDTCEAEWVGEKEAKALHTSLERSLQRELQSRASWAIDRIRQWMSQKELERLLGISPGLLSKLKAGKETSPSLVATLMLLARGPHRVAELQEAWQEEPGVPRQWAVVELDEVKVALGTHSSVMGALRPANENEAVLERSFSMSRLEGSTWRARA